MNEPTQPTMAFPPKYDESRKKCDGFMRSIDPDAVLELASLQKDGNPCHAFREPANGSFNVCYFVEFGDGTRWVVRIPLAPVIVNVWEKVQNEVATLRYLESNTNIPVPHVHAYGPASSEDKSCDSNPTGLAYMIIDCIPGKPLDIGSFIKADRDMKRGLYAQLADIYADLYQQEFDGAGSLMLDRDGEPFLGPLLSIQKNEIELELGKSYPTSKFKSVAGFTSHFFQMLEQKYDLPSEDLDETAAEMEVFALQDLKKRIADSYMPEEENQRFVLSHPDLRWPNIIVDDEWKIQGIIDWEWAGTVPTQYFLPPTWISGRPDEYASTIWYVSEYLYFSGAISAKATSSMACRRLARTWSAAFNNTHGFKLGLILRHQNILLSLYYRGMFSKFYSGSVKVVIREFFERDGEDGEFTRHVRQLLQSSKQYRQYLAENGLKEDTVE